MKEQKNKIRELEKINSRKDPMNELIIHVFALLKLFSNCPEQVPRHYLRKYGTYVNLEDYRTYFYSLLHMFGFPIIT